MRFKPHEQLVRDLADVLDAEAGLREVLIPTRHGEVTSRLADVLDVDAGLTAITSRAAPGGPPEAGRSLAALVARAPVALRLEVRLHPAFTVLRRGPSEVALIREALAAIVAAQGTGVMSTAGDMLRAIGSLDPRISALSRTVGDGYREQLRRRWQVAWRAGDTRPLDILKLISALRAVAELLAEIEGEQEGERVVLVVDLLTSLGLPELDDPVQAVIREFEAIQEALDDLTGVDLREVDLSGVVLDGIRWSTATTWPPHLREQVEQDSVEVEPGLFEIRPGPSADRDRYFA
ncbi:hypothetical protein [Saccharothrix stipae]